MTTTTWSESISAVAPANGAMALPDLRPRTWGALEIFVAIQFLFGVFLFVPGAQAFRPYIRALPYLASLGFLIYFSQRRQSRLVPGSRFLGVSLVLLLLSLGLQGTAIRPGIAQVIFQVSIAAPLFWAGKICRSETQVRRVLWIIFFANAASAAVGVLQAYFPARFLPPQFSALALSLNPEAVQSMTYVGRGGREIVRPPGLTDLPGGAAVAGMLAGFLGLALSAGIGRERVWRLISLGAAAVGLAALYLTQVRSLFLAAVAGLAMLAVMLARQGRGIRGTWIAVSGAGTVLVAFYWAASVGGNSVSERFLGLTQDGVVNLYQQNRGIFLTYTLSELLQQFPFGAGVGRWGMMQAYFGDPSNWQAPPIYVELQLTGWLLDGGIALCILYIAAIAAAIRFSYRVTIWPHPTLNYWAAVVISLQVMLAALAMTGPAFNSQLGIYFWLLTALLAGAVDEASPRRKAS